MHEAARVDHGTLRGDNNIPATSSCGKKRSKAWDDFEDIKDDNGKTVQAECRHCKKRVQYKGAQGTRVLITHVNSAECKNTQEARSQPPSHSGYDFKLKIHIFIYSRQPATTSTSYSTFISCKGELFELL